MEEVPNPRNPHDIDGAADHSDKEICQECQKKYDTDEAEKVHGLDATIGTTFLVLHGLNVL